MQYLIFGAGGIGGTIGAALHLQGVNVQLIARGAHLQKLQANGLEFVTPSRSQQLLIPTLATPTAINIGNDDVVIMAMKSQHTAAALTTLRAGTDAEPMLVCAQNGVDNERQATRLFSRVYGMEVLMPTTHLQPGSVEVHTEQVYGLLDIGRYPGGASIDAAAEALAATLRAAGFGSSARADIMAWKYRKLLRNLGNGLQVLIADTAASRDLVRLLRGEATAVFAAAGITPVADALYRQHADVLDRSNNSHARRQGGSTLQSVLRQADSVETDYLNGEIVLLGRLHGVPTPVNARVQQLTAQHARSGDTPGSLDGVQLLQQARELMQATRADAA